MDQIPRSSNFQLPTRLSENHSEDTKKMTKQFLATEEFQLHLVERFGGFYYGVQSNIASSHLSLVPDTDSHPRYHGLSKQSHGSTKHSHTLIRQARRLHASTIPERCLKSASLQTLPIVISSTSSSSYRTLPLCRHHGSLQHHVRRDGDSWCFCPDPETLLLDL